MTKWFKFFLLLPFSFTAFAQGNDGYSPTNSEFWTLEGNTVAKIHSPDAKLYMSCNISNCEIIQLNNLCRFSGKTSDSPDVVNNRVVHFDLYCDVKQKQLLNKPSTHDDFLFIFRELFSGNELRLFGSTIPAKGYAEAMVVIANTHKNANAQ